MVYEPEPIHPAEYFSELMFFWKYDLFYMIDDVQALLNRVDKAERLTDEGLRKSAFGAVAIKSNALYLGLIMFKSTENSAPLDVELLAPLHQIFADATTTGIVDGRWKHCKYQIEAHLQALTLLSRLEPFAPSPVVETNTDINNPDDVPPDAIELLKSIYNSDPEAKRKTMLVEFRRQRHEKNQLGINQSLGLKLLRGIHRNEI